MKQLKAYYYYACGDNVKSVRFESSESAWKFIESHKGYDCVVERCEMSDKDTHTSK